MTNKVILIGRVGQEPKIMSTKNGGQVISFSFVTGGKYTNKKGEELDSTQWHNISVINSNIVAESASEIAKGRRLHIEGELQYQKYIDKKTNTEKAVTRIVVGYNGVVKQPEQQQQSTQQPINNYEDDEMPF